MSTVISRNNSAEDRVGLYVEHLSRGTIVAGPDVRATAKRIAQLLARPDYYFDEQRASRVIRFIESQIFHHKGPYAGRRFLLNDWEAFVVGCLFGVCHDSDGRRLFDRAYIETAKGSGKTPLSAAIAIYMTAFDGEAQAESYVIATTGEQAKIPMGHIVSQIGGNPALASRFHLVGGSSPTKAYFNPEGFGRRGGADPYLSTYSCIERVSSDSLGAGKSGYQTYFLLTDEYHEHPSAGTHDTMVRGFKNRREPLDLMITNAGEEFLSPCGQEHLLAVNVAHCQTVYDNYFSFVCSLDKKDDPWEDESCWPKTNPSLPEQPGYDYVRKFVREGKVNPSKQAGAARMYFCTWGQAENTWIPLSDWKFKAIPDGELRDLPCYGSLDLSRRRDLTAAALAWKIGENDYYAKVHAWLPAEGLARRSEMEGVPWDLFARRGFLTPTPGNVVNFEIVAEWIKDQMMTFNLVGMAYDNWRIEDLKADLERQNVEVTDLPVLGEYKALWLLSHHQGFYRPKPNERTLWMPGSIDTTEDLVYGGNLWLRDSPILRYAINGAMIDTDESLNRRFMKRRSASKIDALVCLVMALGFARQGSDGFVFSAHEQLRRKALYDYYRDGVPDGAVAWVETDG